MPSAGPDLWLAQAESDRLAASRVYDPADHRTYCQAIANCQQAVEKSVKAIAAALRDARVVDVKRRFYYEHDVSDLISAIMRRPVHRRYKELWKRLGRLFDGTTKSRVRALCALAPAGRPDAGALHARNTEYPYQSDREGWTAPAYPRSFSNGEVAEHARLAETVYGGACEITSAVGRRPAD